MHKIRLHTDVRPVTEFRANTAALIAQVRTTKRPVVLTQRGRGAVVVIDVEEYQKMVEALEAPTDGTPSTWEATHLSGEPTLTGASGGASAGARANAMVDAYKGGIDRSLLRENFARPVGERLRRLAELVEFSEALRRAPRRPASLSTRSPEKPPDPASA